MFGQHRNRTGSPALGSRFPDGSLPRPESRSRKVIIRAVALLAIAVSGVYLTWRLTSTLDLAWWWIAIPLFLAELHNAFGLVLYAIALWDVDPLPLPRTDPPQARVAVLIPTYNEPTEVLLPTIAASVALEPAHETWVLDDGRRDEIRVLAERLGARYLTRPDNRHAKAGNLNHALEVIEADIVAVLDADHVPTARFLTATLPYFGNDRLAFVQTPQDFYNLESFEHERRRNGKVFNEEALFYRVIAPAKGRWQAPFWCGTCALVRVAALRSVGGVATDSVTEDIHTTIRMYRAGWSGAYHNEVLARGLAPDDAASYMLQRNRWARGAMQVLRRENPLFGPGLTAAQRLAFLTTLFGWFDSWRTLAYLLIPLAVVATGAVPINAPGYVFVPAFVVTLAIQFVAMRLLARGNYPPTLTMLFEVLRMPAVLPATLAILAPGRDVRFRVTPKGRQERGRTRLGVPRLLSVLAAASILGLAWFALTILDAGPLHYTLPWAAIGAAFFIGLNLMLLLAAIRRIQSTRFAGNRRAGARVPVHVSARIDGATCAVRDLSISGARLTPAGDPPPVGTDARLVLEIGAATIELRGTIRRHLRAEDGATELGFAFAPGQEESLGRLAVALFHPAVPSDAGTSTVRSARPTEPVQRWTTGRPEGTRRARRVPSKGQLAAHSNLRSVAVGGPEAEPT